MKTILSFATISLVMWLTLGLKEKQSQFDKEEAFEEMLDLEKGMQCQNLMILESEMAYLI